MSSYYYLISSLPQLEFGQYQKIPDYEGTLFFVTEMLNEEDEKEFRKILYPSDVKNLINFIAEKKGLPIPYPYVLKPGFFKSSQISDLWQGKLNPPYFMSELIDENRGRIQEIDLTGFEKRLLDNFYRWVFEGGNSYLRSWFKFDLTLKNTIAVSNSRKYKLDFKDPLLADLIGQTNGVGDLADFTIRDELNISHHDNNPAILEKILDKIRWNYIDLISPFSYFDEKAVFAWFLKFQILHRWIGDWSNDRSKEVINSLSTEILKEFQLPEQFKV